MPLTSEGIGAVDLTGQSQPPRHLSMFLEVSDKEATADWSCFVSHRLVIVNQRDESRSLVKESQVSMYSYLFCSLSMITSWMAWFPPG